MAFPMPPLQPWGSTPLELPPEIQAVVDHIQAATQAPWDLALSPLLCAISVASQRLVEILHPITAKHIPPCLWGFSTGDSGERKSGVDAIATSPHRKFEQELELKRKKLLAAYDVDMQMYEMQRARIIGEARRRSGSFM
ncbi:DUF3987 domain-containing protein, partial [Acinetobacter baumannii]|uniref:DUF3987 domain-containing protein n=1 Tax=Acinetobacter baumannii TaxID=470 RepID=UPI001C03F024